MNKIDRQVFDFACDLYSTRELIETVLDLPIHEFEKEILPGPVLAVGYGMGGLILHYASQGRLVHSIDKERLMKRD